MSKVGTDGRVERWGWDANVAVNGRPFKLEPLYVSLRSHLSQLKAASTPEDVALGVGKVRYGGGAGEGGPGSTGSTRGVGDGGEGGNVGGVKVVGCRV